MAQLNNSIVNGILRASTIATNILRDSTGSAGSNEYILKSDGTNILWVDAATISQSSLILRNANGYTTTVVKNASDTSNYTITMPSGTGTLALNTAFSGATASANGAKGLVPAPAATYQHAFLIGDGNWKKLSILDGGAATTTAWGTWE